MSKKLRDAIALGLCTSNHNQPDQIENEIRDFVAHEVMKFQNDLEERGYEGRELELASSAVADFFHRVFTTKAMK